MENKLIRTNQKLAIFNNVNYVNEDIIWSGKPSQLMNLTAYILSLVIVFGILILSNQFNDSRFYLVLIIPLFFILWATLKTYFTIYILTNERLVKKHGVFNRYTFDIELYRVKDVKLVEPFLFRFFSLGNIRLLTSQKSLQFFFIPAMEEPIALRNNLRILVEKRRRDRGVRELDTN